MSKETTMTRSGMSAITLFGSPVLGQVARSLVDLVTALRHRREVKNLAEFDDHMLKDIGLMRGDVNSALAEPLFLNPSWVLVRCAERHSRSERAAPSVRSVGRPTVPVVKSAAGRYA
jgi:uncharacterized protein YjiS (DUF1127 family)